MKILKNIFKLAFCIVAGLGTYWLFLWAYDLALNVKELSRWP